MVEEPVIVTYEKPRERVLFNTARDANPFLHLYESLWMIAGREDVAPLAYYAKNFLNYSDDGHTLNGAYGYRWRHADTSVEPRDQLEIIIEHLRDNPESRRAVLQMWDVENDLLQIDDSKDVCCNLSVMFSLRKLDIIPHRNMPEPKPLPDRVWFLDMTVTNRSNDMIWGMLGANVVHFSFLQEYMAAHIGVEVGVYNHMTNNLHVYENNWKPQEWLSSPPAINEFYSVGAGYTSTPLVKDPELFDAEMPRAVGKDWEEAPTANEFTEPFLAHVVEPMCRAHYMYKCKDYDAALYWCQRIKAEDWERAAHGWLERRIYKKEKA